MSVKYNHLFCLFYSWLIKLLTAFLPDQKHIMRFRGWLYSFFMKECGKNFQVSSTTILKNLENMEIGDNVYFAPNSIINASATIRIENEVMIAFNSVLVSGNHILYNGSYRFGKSKLKPIVINEGAWIAANCTVVAGANIGKGCLIGANSLVKGDCLDYHVYIGVPAVSIGVRKNDT
jgi:acetyltransferase-like isoleucine patch superfamily enzyme